MNKTATQTSYRARWYNRAGIWIGIGINPASITLGGGLASEIAINHLFWLVPISTSLLTLLCVTAGTIGRRRRESFSAWSASTFGDSLGATLINLVMALGMTGWAGFQMGLGGTSLGQLFLLPGWVGVILLSVSVVYLGNLGVNRWNWFVWCTTLSAISMAIIALIIAVGLSEPQPQAAQPLTVGRIFWTIGSILAFASLFSVRSTDFTYDLASDFDVWLDALCFFFTFSTSLLIGILLFRATGSWDLAIILAETPVAIIGQLFLFVSLLAPALSTIHSGALAWKHVLPLSYLQGIIFIVAIGMCLGLLRFDQQLLQFLDWLGAVFPPAIVVLVAAALIEKRLATRFLLAAWIIGATIGLGFKINGQIIHLFAGSLTTLTILIVGYQTQRFTLVEQK